MCKPAPALSLPSSLSLLMNMPMTTSPLIFDTSSSASHLCSTSSSKCQAGLLGNSPFSLAATRQRCHAKKHSDNTCSLVLPSSFNRTREAQDQVPATKFNSEWCFEDSDEAGTWVDSSHGDDGMDDTGNALSAGVPLDRDRLMRGLGCCARSGDAGLGEEHHALVFKAGLHQDRYVGASVLSMYAKSGRLDSARKVFEGLPAWDVVIWNSLVSGYADHGFLEEALSLFSRIVGCGMHPTCHTYSIVFRVCGDAMAVEEGRQIHAQAIKLQFIYETAVGNAVLTMYGKFDMIEEAAVVFKCHSSRNHISWTGFITALYHNRCFQRALTHFCDMRGQGVKPNEYTYTVALSCCSSMKQLMDGRGIHALVIKDDYATGKFVGTSIVDMYSSCAEMSDAERRLKEMETVASWNAMLNGYIIGSMYDEALEAFCRMLEAGIVANHFTYSTILKGCASVTSLALGMQIHAQVVKSLTGLNGPLGSSLIQMYSNCGYLTEAVQTFDEMKTRDTVIWNSMLKALSQHGDSQRAMRFFSRMGGEGIRPTATTFLAILSACSHSGLLLEGRRFFDMMVQDYGLAPEETHYSCIVDMLGRAGHLEEAKEFINSLSVHPTASIWRPLLAACRFHNNLEMAESVAKCIIEEDPNDPAVYVTLSNMYAEASRWDSVVKQRILMADRQLKKEPGCSWMEVEGKIHRFFSKDRTHPETSDIYNKLEELAMKIAEIGSLNAISDEDHAMHHSERLAVSYGLIGLPHRKPIRVFKNLRVCADCHTFIRYISAITGRAIILKDNYRFHHFEGGNCSCRNYW